jgi:hypothetical protein
LEKRSKGRFLDEMRRELFTEFTGQDTSRLLKNPSCHSEKPKATKNLERYQRFFAAPKKTADVGPGKGKFSAS